MRDLRGSLIKSLRKPITPGEVETVHALEKRLTALYQTLSIDLDKYAWKIGVRRGEDGSENSIEVILPVHHSDPRAMASLLWHGRFRFPVEAAQLAGTSFSPLEGEIEEIARYLTREKDLVAAGWDPKRPPASTFSTDLISLRTLVARNIDLDLLVADAPRSIRSRRRIHKKISEGSFWLALSMFPLFPCKSKALPRDFYPFRAGFRIDRLEVGLIQLSPDLQIEPDVNEEIARVTILGLWPESIANAAVGVQMNKFVEHNSFDDPRITIRNVDYGSDKMTVSIINPFVAMVPLGSDHI